MANIGLLFKLFWLTFCSISLCVEQEGSIVEPKFDLRHASEGRMKGKITMNCSDSELDDEGYKRCEAPWQYCDSGECRCGNQTLHDSIRCDTRKNLTVLTSYCVTFNEEEGMTELGNCIYNHRFKGDDYYELPLNLSELNEYVCGEVFNRKGTLCGKCKDGYSPRAYSLDIDCIECPHSRVNWWKYLLIAFGPLTVFCLLIFLFNINVTSSHLLGFVVYCQSAYFPALVRVYLLNSKYSVMLLRILSVLYGFWNLDFFRALRLDICLGTDTLQTLALDVIVGVYPLALVILCSFLIHLHDRNCSLLVACWKPLGRVFRLFRRNWNIKTSLIDAFSTFFLLSNAKLLEVSFDLLVPVRVYQLMPSGNLNSTWRVYYDATIPYFGARHLPYAILALLVLVLFVVLPTLLLILYPFTLFQRFLNLFPFRWYILHTFVDSFQGCFKDGTEPGTRDCRWFASFFFILRLCSAVIGILTLNVSYFLFTAIILTLLFMVLVLVEPFKANAHHAAISYTVSTFLLALFSTGSTGVFIESIILFRYLVYASIALIILLPIIYIAVMTLLWAYNHRLILLRCLCPWRQGYQALVG